MKKILMVIFIIVFLCFTATALFAGSCFNFSDISGENQIFDEHYADLDNDGIPEKIALKSYNLQIYQKNIQQFFGQIVVFKSINNDYIPVWESPKLAHKPGDEFPGNKYRFYFGDVGMEPLEVVGDINNDGKIEILSPKMQSDVRPAQYRLYCWDGKKFDYVREGYLLAASKQSGKFEWKDSYTFKDGSFGNPWISCFTDLFKPGFLIGNVVFYEKSQTSIFDEVYFKCDKDCFTTIKILSKIKY